MQKIIPALIKAKKNFKKISKDAVNPYFKSKYATLDAVLDATESALAEQGLTIVQVVEGFTISIRVIEHLSNYGEVLKLIDNDNHSYGEERQAILASPP